MPRAAPTSSWSASLIAACRRRTTPESVRYLGRRVYLAAVVVSLLAGMLVLSELGISVAPILGAAGVVGLAVGFGISLLQTLTQIQEQTLVFVPKIISIFLALLGKQYGVTPSGWRAAAGDYGKAGTHMSIADVVDKGSLDQVRAYKKKMKAAAKAKA